MGGGGGGIILKEICTVSPCTYLLKAGTKPRCRLTNEFQDLVNLLFYRLANDFDNCCMRSIHSCGRPFKGFLSVTYVIDSTDNKRSLIY
jgi:hypothetical protein